MFANYRMATPKKHYTRKQRKQRKQRQRQRKSTSYRQRQRRRHGGGALQLNPASVEESLAGSGPSLESFKQGEEFVGNTKAFHGGAAPFGAADSATLPDAMRGPAGIMSQDEAFNAIKGMRDDGVVTAGQTGQAGGKRRRHRASRKHRKASRKQRNVGHKQRKASRKQRKANRKSRKQRQGGGGCIADTAAPFTNDKSSEMLLKDYSGAGLHAEWKDVAAADGGDFLGPKL